MIMDARKLTRNQANFHVNVTQDKMQKLTSMRIDAGRSYFHGLCFVAILGFAYHFNVLFKFKYPFNLLAYEPIIVCQ